MSTKSVNGRMHATLVRFGPELLRAVKAEASADGVSVAQYVREAVWLRIAYSAGRRGDPPYDAALEELRGNGARTPPRRDAATNGNVAEENEALRAEARLVVARSAQLQRASRKARDGSF